MLKEGNLIGVALYEKWMPSEDTLHLCELAILPEEQRQGYGTALIEAFKTSSLLPIKRIIADTRAFNLNARDFYKKLGFKEGDPHDPELAGNKSWVGLEWRYLLTS